MRPRSQPPKGDKMDIREIFIEMAKLALEAGYEIMLEQKNYDCKSKTFGSLASTDSLDTGLVFRAYPSQCEEDEEETEE